jgi:hypothetical protein
MSDDLNGDYLLADEKIRQGTDWEDSMPIPIAGEKMEFGFTLLNERVRQEVQNCLPIDEFRKYKQSGMSEEQERLMELQRKDELTEEEQDELIELAEEVNPEDEGRESLPDEAVDALMDAGKHAIKPTEGDVQDIISADPETQERVFGEIPEHLDTDTAESLLREYMREQIEGQPFPIKFSLGQRAYMETVAVQGNGFQST